MAKKTVYIRKCYGVACVEVLDSGSNTRRAPTADELKELNRIYNEHLSRSFVEIEDGDSRGYETGGAEKVLDRADADENSGGADFDCS